MSALYDAVENLCHARGISVSRACTLAGVSPGILSDLKKGRKKSISVKTAAKLAHALGVSLDALSGASQGDEDAFLAFYGQVKAYLDEKDKNDLMAYMRIKAELKKNRAALPH